MSVLSSRSLALHFLEDAKSPELSGWMVGFRRTLHQHPSSATRSTRPASPSGRSWTFWASPTTTPWPSPAYSALWVPQSSLSRPTWTLWLFAGGCGIGSQE